MGIQLPLTQRVRSGDCEEVPHILSLQECEEVEVQETEEEESTETENKSDQGD